MWYKPSACRCVRGLYRKTNMHEKEVNCSMQCQLCNEHIEDVEFQFEDAFEIDGEFWHSECYAEYFGEVYEEVA